MITQHFKRIATIALTSMALLSTSAFGFAEYHEIDKTITTKKISTGVAEKNIRIFTDQGWIIGHAIIADLSDPNTDITLLKPTVNLSTSESLSKMMLDENTVRGYTNKDEEIIAAINGDFFDYKAHTPLGPVIDDGIFYASKYNDPTLSTFEILKSRIGTINSYTNPVLTFNNQTRDATPLVVDYFNKPYLKGNAAVCMTGTYRKQTLGYDGVNDIYEIIVENDVITERRYNLPAVAIPQNGYVISAYNDKMVDLALGFLVGHSVGLTTDRSGIQDILLSIGGGSTLIENGSIPETFSMPINGIHPRSAIGVDESGKRIILLSINGRKSTYRGASERELANILLDLGAYNAINLDGGGSTELISTDPGTAGTSIASYLSDGRERSIYNGIGIIDRSLKTSEIGKLDISTTDMNMFNNTSRVFTYKGYDKNYNTIDIPEDKITWTVSGVKGHFQGSTFHASSTGSGTIYALYENTISSQKIVVHDGVERMVVSPSRISHRASKPIKFTAYGYTHTGQKIAIDPNDLTWTIPKKIGYLESGRLVVKNLDSDNENAAVADNPVPTTNDDTTQENKDVKTYDEDSFISVAFGSVEKYIPVSVGSSTSIYEDFQTLTSTEDLVDSNFSFSSYPEEVTGALTLTDQGYNSNKGLKLNYDFTRTDATRAAYLNLSENLIFHENTTSVGFWVNGSEGNGHWLRATLIDADGVAQTFDLSKDTSWQDWQFKEISIPSDMAKPVRLSRIYLVEPDNTKKDTGAILIDDLIVEIGSQFSETPSDKEFKISWESNGLQFGIGDNFIYTAKNNTLIKVTKNPNTGSNGTSLSQSSINESLNINPHSITVKINNINSGIAKNGIPQWTALKNGIKTAQSEDKPLVVYFSNKYYFSDSQEEDLFLEKLEALAESNDVYLIFNNEPKTYMKKYNGLNLIKLGKDHENSLLLTASEKNIHFDFMTDSELDQLLKE